MQIDLSALMSKVIEQVLAKYTQAAPLLAAGGEAVDPVDLIARGIAGRLVTMLGVGEPPGADPAQPSREDLERICAHLAARNRAAASAVGACECWGELPDCPTCSGHGGSGWRRPDGRAFDALVTPVLRRLRQHRFNARGTRAVNQ